VFECRRSETLAKQKNKIMAPVEPTKKGSNQIDLAIMIIVKTKRRSVFGNQASLDLI